MRLGRRCAIHPNTKKVASIEPLGVRRIDRVEKIEEFMEVFFDMQLTVRPGGKRYALLEVFDLKPIFNVDS
jgi:hypothetical protein